MNNRTIGFFNGLAGMLIFSASLPATRLAVQGLDPLFVTGARGALAAVLSLASLLIWKAPWPNRRDIGPLAITSLGVVAGFPLLTAFALRHMTSAHSLVFIGLLPLATAVFGVLRGGERPRPAFWLFSILGSLVVVGYALSRGGDHDPLGDGLMLAAILVCGLGYAEGGRLARHMGGLQVICWALVLGLPVMALLAAFTWPADWSGVPVTAWAGLAYVTVFSMFVGFVFWYRGLAFGGIAVVGQLQLLQPFFGLLLAGLLLGERVEPAMVLASVAVVGSVALARRFG